MKSFVEHREIQVKGYINSVAYCKGRLAIGTEYPNIVIYKETKADLGVYQDNLLAHSGGVSALCFSPGGALLFSGGRDLKIVVWRLGEDFRYSFLYLVNIEAEGKSYPNQMAWRDTERAGMLFVTRYRQPDVLIYAKNQDSSKLEKCQNLNKNRFDTHVIAVTMDAEKVFIAGDMPEKLNIMIWGFDQKNSKYQEIYSLEGHEASVIDLAVSLDGRTLVSGDFKGKIIIWKPSQKNSKFEKNQVIETPTKQAVGSLDLSPNGELIIVGSHDKSVKIFKQDLEDEYQLLDDFRGHKNKILNTMLTADGNYVVTCGIQDTVKIRGLKNIRQKYIDFGEKDSVEGTNKQDIWGIHMSRDYQMLITTSKAPDFVVWRYSQKLKKYIFSQKYEGKGVSRKQNVPLSISRDGKHIIFGVDDRVIFLIKIYQKHKTNHQKILKNRSQLGNSSKNDGIYASFEISRQWGASKKSISTLTFFEENNSLDFVMGDEMKSITLWRYQKNEKCHRLSQLMIGHIQPISSLVISGDSKTLISGGDDKMVKLWARISKKNKFECAQTVKIKSKVCCLILANMAKMLIVGGKDKSIRVFLKGSEGKFALVQEFRKVMKYIGNFFGMQLFDGDRFLVTLQKSGAPCKVWFVDDHCLKEIGEIDFDEKNQNLEKSKKAKIEDKNRQKDVERVHRISVNSDFSRMVVIKTHSKTKIELIQLKSKMAIEHNFEYYELLRDLFAEKTRFISPEALNQLIEHLQPKSKKNFISLQRIHSGINLLLLAVLSREPRLLKKALTNFGYTSYFFEKEFDPLDHAIKLNDRQLLHVIVDYFSVETNKIKFLSFLTFERYCKAMKTSSEEFKQFVTSIYLEDPSKEHPDLHPEYPISKIGYRLLRTDFRLYDQNLRSEIDRMAAAEPRTSGTPCLVKHLIPRFQLPKSIFDEVTYEQLLVMEGLSDEMILSDYRFILKFIWEENHKKILLISTLHCLTYAIFVFEIVWDPKNRDLGALSLTMPSLFLVYELMIALKTKNTHCLRSVSTWFDIYTYLAPCLITASNLSNNLHLDHIPTNFWVDTTILLVGFKTLGELRILDSVRHMVAMLFQALVDMLGFVIILVCSITFFSIARISSSWLSGAPTLTFQDFFLAMDYYYNVANGNWEGSDRYNAVDYFLYVLSGIFLAVVLLNLVIAVISLTFENLEEVKELVDLREMTKILLSRSAFCSYFSRFGWFRRRFEAQRSLYCMILKADHRDSELKALVKDSTSRLVKILKIDEKRREAAKERVFREIGSLRDENKHLRGMVKQIANMLEEQGEQIGKMKEMISEKQERSIFELFNQEAAESEVGGKEKCRHVKKFTVKQNKFKMGILDAVGVAEHEMTGKALQKLIKDDFCPSSTSRKG